MEYHICEYGCGRKAIKQFPSNSKWCCSEHYLSCPGVIKLRENNNLKKYGVKNPQQIKEVQEKTRKTCEEKYGGVGYAGKCGLKSRQTTKDLFGFEHATSAPIIKKKRINTFIEKYGVKNPSLIKEVKEKKKETCMKNFGVEHPMYDESVKSKLRETTFKNHGVEWGGQTKKSRDINRERMLNGGAILANQGITNPSKPQVELWNICQEIFPLAIINYPCIWTNKSIDIAIPHLAVAIEYDGSYWHKGKEEEDMIRQQQIEEQGWNVIRYVDKIPTKKRLLKDVNKILRSR